MTLLDAPKFDAVRERRRRVILYSTAGVLLALFVGWWLVAGRPVDWPWNWNALLQGRMAMNRFLTAVEKNDLPAAYGIWHNDKDWQQHPKQSGSDTFARFEENWSPQSHENDYGAIQSHKIVAERRWGNGVLFAAMINGRKSKALNLFYDPQTHTLDFPPPDVELYLGP
jgi:hypothetical protein